MTNSPEMRALDPTVLANRAKKLDAGGGLGYAAHDFLADLIAYFAALSASHAQGEVTDLRHKASTISAEWRYEHPWTADLIDDLVAALPHSDGAVAEPEGWLVHDDPELGDYLTKSRDAAARSGKPITPLFTSPINPVPAGVGELKRYSLERLTGSVTLLPVVRDDGDWVKFADAAALILRQAPDAEQAVAYIYRSQYDNTVQIAPADDFIAHGFAERHPEARALVYAAPQPRIEDKP